MVLCGGQIVVDHQETAQFLAVEMNETVGCDGLRKCDWEDGAVGAVKSPVWVTSCGRQQ